MNYAVRVWLDDTFAYVLDTPIADVAMEKFREIVAAPRTQRVSVTVNAEPAPFPARSWTIARYQS